MLNLDFEKSCVGCTACQTICSRNAIHMIISAQGFRIAAVDEERCVACGACERVCPVVNHVQVPHDNQDSVCKYVFSLDDGNRNNSTSGGIFFELAKMVLNQKGIVCGCVWDDSFVARHICTDSFAVVEKMRGSKYVQSDMGNCFQQILEHIETRKVLFVGTPCQTTALYKLVEKKDNLLLCALMCEGTPSPEVWRMYKDHLETRYHSKVKNVCMRSKALKWLVPTLKVDFMNGRNLCQPLAANPYGAALFSVLIIGDACFNCTNKLDKMRADILIGDHWGLDGSMLIKSENMGMSAMILLSQRGKDAFDLIRGRLFVASADIDDVISSHQVIVKRHKPYAHREAFFSELKERDIIENLTMHTPAKNHSRLRKLLYKTGLYAPLYTAIWKHRH